MGQANTLEGTTNSMRAHQSLERLTADDRSESSLLRMICHGANTLEMVCDFG